MIKYFAVYNEHGVKYILDRDRVRGFFNANVSELYDDLVKGGIIMIGESFNSYFGSKPLFCTHDVGVFIFNKDDCLKLFSEKELSDKIGDIGRFLINIKGEYVED